MSCNFKNVSYKPGQIHFPERKKQLLDYSGLKLGNITPTDLDGLIEWHNEKYILIEVKYGNAPMPTGQKIALERMAADLHSKGKNSIVLLAQHNVKDCAETVDFTKCTVREIYYPSLRKWLSINSGLKADDLIYSFLGVTTEEAPW